MERWRDEKREKKRIILTEIYREVARVIEREGKG